MLEINYVKGMKTQFVCLYNSPKSNKVNTGVKEDGNSHNLNNGPDFAEGCEEKLKIPFSCRN